MFKDNKYKTIYFNIIHKAHSRNQGVKRSLLENHHIVPKSLGGSNRKTNLILLTPKEHFLCHKLLTKMTEGEVKRKMIYALWRMSNKGNTVRGYEYVRRLYCENHPTKHRVLTDQQREKMRAANLGRVVTSLTKRRMSLSAKARMKDQRGINNPVYRGLFITPWGSFHSALEAEKKSPVGMGRKFITAVCKNNERILKPKYHKDIPTEWYGKTFIELGFDFQEKE